MSKHLRRMSATELGDFRNQSFNAGKGHHQASAGQSRSDIPGIDINGTASIFVGKFLARQCRYESGGSGMTLYVCSYQ